MFNDITKSCTTTSLLLSSHTDRSVAELQVAEVKANLTSRPFDTSLSFTVHSLLIVDAMQTFGADYELLVASHKNLWYACARACADGGDRIAHKRLRGV